jgi:hypothetical protein
MCYNKNASLKAFITGIVSSLLLIRFGDVKYKNTNLGIGILFFIISFMQLFDYMIWTDLDCTQGYNKLAGILGPLFNALQPTILYIYILYSNKNNKTLVNIVNIIYIGYIIYIYNNYLKQDICSRNENGRVKWSWYNSFGFQFGIIYLIILIFNAIYIVKNKYSIITSILVILFLGISIINYKYHVGEFWCYFVNSIPLIILGLQKLNI